MLQLKVFPQYDKLEKDQQKTKKYGKFSQGKWEIQTENIGDGRYGRCSQIGLCDQTDPQ